MEYMGICQNMDFGGYDGTIMEIYGLWMSMVNLMMENVVQN